MLYSVDSDYLIRTFTHIVSTPSPVGYPLKMNPLLEQYARELGYSVTYDNRSTAYLTVEGQDSSRTVMVGAHADTLGLMVRKIEKDGTLRVRNLGGINFQNIEGESVDIFTRDGRSYTGLICCQSHSTHVFDDARTLERSEKTMLVLLDEAVSTEEQVRALGIRHGDVVAIQPRPQFTKTGFLKSRYIDNKGSIACCFTALRYLREHGLIPKYRTVFAFPYREEIGQGGSYVPPEVSEYVAMDIGLIGPDYDGNEFAVSICAKDNAGTYDYELTGKLIHCAEAAGCDHAVDIYYHYSTDANAAVRAGCNVRHAAFGMAVYCSHGMERTHIRGLENTTNLLIAYLLDL